MTAVSEPGRAQSELAVPDPVDREVLRAYLRRLLRMDEAAVVRIVPAPTPAGATGRLRVWSRTPLGPLAVRTVDGHSSGEHVVGADHLLTELDVLPSGDPRGELAPGYPLSSAWSGLLPPEDGFARLETVPAQVVLELAEAGRAAADDSGPLGLPPSLLDGTALTVTGESAETGTDQSAVEVPLRVLFALVGCGFVPARGGRAPEGERVVVSGRGRWTRLDARFGAVVSRPETLPLTPTG